MLSYFDVLINFFHQICEVYGYYSFIFFSALSFYSSPSGISITYILACLMISVYFSPFFFFNYCPWNVWTVLVQFQVHNFSFLSAQIYCCPLLSGIVIVVTVLFNFRISIWPHNLYLICFPYLGHYCSMSFIIYTLFIYLNEVL